MRGFAPLLTLLISPKGPKYVAQTDFFLYIDEDFVKKKSVKFSVFNFL